MQFSGFCIAQNLLRVTKFKDILGENSFTQNVKAMKTLSPRKLNKRIQTVCDFNPIIAAGTGYSDTTITETGGTDTTNTTITIITTANTHAKA
jgi:hypothetical protein